MQESAVIVYLVNIEDIDNEMQMKQCKAYGHKILKKKRVIMRRYMQVNKKILN